MKQQLLKTLAFNYNSARALFYTAESLPLPLINRLITGHRPYIPTRSEQDAVIQSGRRLLETDAEDFSNGIFPNSVYLPEHPVSHFPRLFWLFTDGARASLRRRLKKTREFSRAADRRDEFPEYYRRNFHHQTDGYLSEDSAELYEHQVELLFRGMAEPMRRRLLKPMVGHLGDGEGMMILEVGCGTGTFTRSLALTFPKAQITAVDLSPSYIKKAKQRFLKFKNVHFMTADAQKLPFRDQQFDAVVSVFMHHELPRDVRADVVNESFRVTRPNGFWGLLDSLQMSDTPELDWALREFPKTFHEPFYKNYVNTPLMDLAKNAPLSPGKFKEEHHFFSKMLYHQGSSEPSQE